MKNKICLITGANADIGLETAKGLARRGATTLLICRSEEKAQKALITLHKEIPDGTLDYAIANLTSQGQIRMMTENFKASTTRSTPLSTKQVLGSLIFNLLRTEYRDNGQSSM